MYQRTKKAITFFLASLLLITQSSTAMAQTTTFTDSSNIHSDLTGDYGILGIASQFHIFSKNNTTLFTHTNGNIATENLDAKVNFGTNIKEQESYHIPLEINYAKNISYIASSAGVSSTKDRQNKFVVGKSVTLILVDNGNAVAANSYKLDHFKANEIYQDQNSNYIDFQKEFDSLISTSNTLSSQKANLHISSEQFSDMNNRKIDLSSFTSGNVFIDIESSVLELNTPLTISNPNNVMLIFNVVNSSDTLNIQSQIKYNNRSNKETEDFTDANILWNFGNSIKSISVNSPFQGTVLSPNSSVDARQNLDGSIIATNVTINAESHRWDLNSIHLSDTQNKDNNLATQQSSNTEESSSTTQQSSSTEESSSTTQQSSNTEESSSTTQQSSNTEESDPATTGTSNNEDDLENSLPKTGSQNIILMSIFGFILVGFGAVLTFKKYKRN